MTEDRARKIEVHETRLEELRRMFDLYFQGLERIPPQDDRDKLRKDLNRLQGETIRWSTALRYRMGSLMQRFNSYDQMWRRTMTAIENGTHTRDRFRAAMNKKRGQAPPKEAPGAPPDIPAKAEILNDEKRLQKIYKAYVKARKMTGQPTTMSYDAMSQRLKEQIPKLHKKHPGKKVDFKVVLKNGKAILKPVVR